MSSVVPGLGLRLVVGLAGIVSRRWPPVTGDDDSSTVWRLCGSTDEVSQESKSSAPLKRSRRPNELDRWLRRLVPDNRRVLDDMGRTAFVNVEATDEMVSAAENPPLDMGGNFESIETFRVAGSEGLVLVYGIVLTRVAGKRRPTSCMLGEGEVVSSCGRSMMKRATRKNSCVTKETASTVDTPATKPRVFSPAAALLDRQMSSATVIAAATTQRTITEPKTNPLTVLASLFSEAKRIHDSAVSTASSEMDAIEAVTLVDCCVGFE